MPKADNFLKYIQLRRQYPVFIYEGYSHSYSGNKLLIEFNFDLSGRYLFRPNIVIPLTQFNPSGQNQQLSVDVLNNLVFHIGMVELISYWKATCSPKIIIRPHILDNDQVTWWKKLFFNGLGEFFYMNSIPASIEDFVQINPEGKNKPSLFSFRPSPSYLVPVGGGKDSAVTLELLSRASADCIPFVINHRRATRETTRTAGFSSDKTIEFHRELDPQLLKLNEKGYLNGHTPFSALLAFNSLLAAYLGKTSNIALSNESSANEATIPGSSINHQYSKSFEFEQDFRGYVNKNISGDFNYFSFLRPLSELQISKIFSGLSKYFEVFRSCNEGSKTNAWCGKCPKCLFTFIILSPFLTPADLRIIFGRNLFADEKLKPILDQLTGITNDKPFDCIGTHDEVNIALGSAIEAYHGSDLPVLLSYYNNQKLYHKYSSRKVGPFLKKFDKHHNLTKELLNLLKQELT